MTPRWSATPAWSRFGRAGLAAAVLAATAGLVAPTAQAAPAAAPSGPAVEVIVREFPGAGDRPEAAVASLGGSIKAQLGLIGGFAAVVPADAVDVLRTAPGVFSVSEDRAIQLNSYDGFDPVADLGSTYVAADVIGANDAWAAGHTGQGIGVALIDSGIAPVNGLTYPGQIVLGPDLSPEGQFGPLNGLDTFGHGTHMGGIIAGRDDELTTIAQHNPDRFTGIAPGAKLISVKVADASGSTDITQVIAAIDWVVQHRDDEGMNIRVLNLSFGTDSVQDYRIDPLTYAVEQAWLKGIVVVVSAGNDGVGTTEMNNPAYDPYVLAVGGADGNGTRTVDDDVVGTFSSRGSATRTPDLVAPGKSVVSLRSPGSYADVVHVGGHVGTRLMRGSGTSQAAAVVSGASAVLLSQRPELTPDQVKALLVGTAKSLPQASATAQGAGMIDVAAAVAAATPALEAVTQTFERSTGLGSVEASRGSFHVFDAVSQLLGEFDIHGKPFVAAERAALTASETAWDQGWWNGTQWTGTGFHDVECPAPVVTEPVTEEVTEPLDGAAALLDPPTDPVDEVVTPTVITSPLCGTWDGTQWLGNTWNGNTWNGNTWNGNTWNGNTWNGNSWNGAVWLGNSWNGNTWNADDWAGNTWNGNTWNGNTWNGNTWNGNTWNGNTWNGNSWNGNSWNGNSWNSMTWDTGMWSMTDWGHDPTPKADLDRHQGKRLKDDVKAQKAQKAKKDKALGKKPKGAVSGLVDAVTKGGAK